MPRAQRLSLVLAAAAAVAACAGCSPFRPPYTQPAAAIARTDPQRAALVFLWPASSCDPPGHLTLASTDGRFLGNMSRGSRLEVLVPPGERDVIAWNDVMESARGAMERQTAPVLHATLAAGRTYFVRVAFGEWDDAGPTRPGSKDGTVTVNGNTRYQLRSCVGDANGVTSAMVSVAPTSNEWPQVPGWMMDLEPFAPEQAEGQAWLDANRSVLAAHLPLARERFAALGPEGKRLATIGPEDGAPQR